MKREDISDSLNMLDDDIIVGVEQVRNCAIQVYMEEEKQAETELDKLKTGNFSKKADYIWLKLGTLVACLCVVVIVSVVFSKTISKNDDIHTDITIAENQQEDGLQMLELDFVYEGGSFEGLMYPSVDELYEMQVSNNPWDETMVFDTLPVYKDLAHTGNGVGIAIDEETMREMAQDIADKIGAEILEIELEKYKLNDEWIITSIEAETDIAQIDVSGDGSIRIQYSWFEYGIGDVETTMKLPDEIDSDDTEAAIKYWAEKMSAVINNSQINFSAFNSYDFNRNLGKWNYNIYDASGNDEDDILNYIFGRIGIGLDETGNLTYITIEDALAYAEKIGDYPVISKEDARELLLEGTYLTSVPYKITDEKYVASVELVYRSANHGEYMIPYYRFYVEIPEEDREGLNCYGAYYVPAVKQEYISEIQIYSGSFQ